MNRIILWNLAAGTIMFSSGLTTELSGIYVRESTERPSLRGPNIVSIDSGAGLANATTGQRLVSVRLFY